MSPKRKVVSTTSFVDPSKVGRRRSADVSRERIGTVEAEWSCTSCGTDQIPGFTKNCPKCGNPRNPDEVYQPPNWRTAKLLSAKELLEAGIDEDHSSDQQCGYCAGFSKPGTKKCPNCGANLTDVARTCRKCPNCELETNDVTCSQCGETTQPKSPRVIEAIKSALPTLSFDTAGFDLTRLFNFWWVSVVVLVLGLIAWALWPRQALVTVNDAWWTYTVSLQVYQYNAHEGWSPMGDVTGQEERIHHYDTIIDGYHEECETRYEVTGYETVSDTETVCESVYSHSTTTCYDDGSCDTDDVYETECHQEPTTRQEAVYGNVEYCSQVADTHDEARYATWYFYNVWEWVGISPAITSKHDFAPFWSTDFKIDDKHRESGRQEEYDITLVSKDGEDTYSYSPVNFADYNQYQIGTQWLITYSGGMITEIEPAQ